MGTEVKPAWLRKTPNDFFQTGLPSTVWQNSPGVPKNDQAIQRALVFINRCQNLPGETNNLPYAQKAAADDKGGFVYNPADEGLEQLQEAVALAYLHENYLNPFAFPSLLRMEREVVAMAADLLTRKTTLWVHATSLGGVESTFERRRRWRTEPATIPDGLVRMSVGIEDVDDLWDDLASALDDLVLPG